MSCASMHRATGGSGSPSPVFLSQAALAQLRLAEFSRQLFGSKVALQMLLDFLHLFLPISDQISHSSFSLMVKSVVITCAGRAPSEAKQLDSRHGS